MGEVVAVPPTLAPAGAGELRLRVVALRVWRFDSDEPHEVTKVPTLDPRFRGYVEVVGTDLAAVDRHWQLSLRPSQLPYLRRDA